MLIAADAATGQTIALLITFLGIGLLVNVLIVYIIALVLGERNDRAAAAAAVESSLSSR
jgi:hypothetical protein